MGLFLLVAILGGCSEAPAQDSGGPLPPEQAAYDVTYYDLAVTVDPARERIQGRLSVRAVVEQPLEVLVLNLDRRLTVQRAWSGGAPGAGSLAVERRAGGNERWIALDAARDAGDTLSVTVEYEGTPRVAPRPPWEGGFTWAETPGDAPWIATSCQTEGADLWWPVKDHPSDEPDSMDIAITVPDGLVAASNGALRRVERASEATRTYHWHVSTPINAYAVALNVAPYTRLDTSYASIAGRAIPISFYALPSDSAQAHTALPPFLDQLRFLEKTLGPYPFRADKYGIAQVPFLGMEHQSIIAYGHTFEPGGLGYEAPFDALHFHELAHEWYGNLVTVADWKDFWLHEGPATYLEALYAESLQGDSAYHALTDHFRAQIAGDRAIARREPTTAESIYHRDVYYRGALTLHTLRYLVGETAVRRLLRRFVDPSSSAESPSFRHVTTQDFVQLAEQISGQTLDAFFEVYLYQDSLPILDTTLTADSLRLQWTNTSDTSFEVPVPVQVNGTMKRTDMTGGEGHLPLPDGAAIRIDPKGWILRAGTIQ